MVALLKNIDYSCFNVTLGIEYPVKELETEIPDKVKIIYYGEISSRLYRKIFDFNKKLGKQKQNPIKRFFWHCLNKLENLRMIYQVKKNFNKKYDTVNAYHQGVASRYAIKYIHAKKKILWYHASIIEYAWYKKIFSRANIIVANSENVRKMLLGEWGNKFSKKIEVIECFISVDEIIKKSLMPIQIDLGKRFKIITCGRLSPEKGMDLAIEAAKYIKDITDDFIWLIIGDGKQKKLLEEKICNLDLNKNVKLVGYFENPYPIFKMCDIYVAPSRLESYGLTIVEALVFAKPVVTTKTDGGLTNIINEYNGLYADFDSKSIAENVIRLMTDNKLLGKIRKNISNINFKTLQEKKISCLNEMQCCKKGG